MNRTLLLMRHAKSSWNDASLPDEERPLNKRGREAAKRMGRYLREHGLVPDAIVCSTAVRARETAERLIAATGSELEPQFARSLYFEGINAYLEAIGGAEDSVRRLMVIGHNPDIEEVIERIVGVNEAMPTGAIACVEVKSKSWREFGLNPRGRLLDVLRPKSLEED